MNKSHPLMSAWQLYPEGQGHPDFSTPEYHASRPPVPSAHPDTARPRLAKAAACVFLAAIHLAEAYGGRRVSVSDLGCGDATLLTLLKPWATDTGLRLRTWGYDVNSAYQQAWQARGVDCSVKDVFGGDRESVTLGRICVLTHVLHCVAEPYSIMEWVGQHCAAVVVSAPSAEKGGKATHEPDHTWAWDFAGLADLVRRAGFLPVTHEPVDTAQVMLAMRDDAEFSRRDPFLPVRQSSARIASW